MMQKAKIYLCAYPKDRMADKIGMLLFKEKQLRIIISLSITGKDWYLSDLAKASNVTYMHTSKFIERCEKAGLLSSERHGRIKKVALTEKGNAVASSIKSIMEKIGDQEQRRQQ